MKKDRPCRLCSSKRYANTSWCYLHLRSREKAGREEKARKKNARRLGSKKYEESQRKGLKKKLDIAFSELIRSLGKCERCGLADYSKLQTSHIYTRANLAVRWDELNAKCLCAGCHWAWHKEPLEGTAWLASVRTPEQLAELRRRANAVKHWSVPELKQLLAHLSEKLKKL